MTIRIVIDADDKDVEALLDFILERHHSYGKQLDMLERTLEWLRIIGSAASCRTLTGSCQASIRIGGALPLLVMRDGMQVESSACQDVSREEGCK
jgi:hypothetical protein